MDVILSNPEDVFLSIFILRSCSGDIWHNTSSQQSTARWRSGAPDTERCALFLFWKNINGKSEFACPAVCANGRTGKAGLAGGVGGRSPVSAQSTTKASENTTETPVWRKSPLKRRVGPFFFFFVCKSEVGSLFYLYLCVCVCAHRPGWFAAPHRLHTSLSQCGWRRFCEITS